jgi:hypothetical protein
LTLLPGKGRRSRFAATDTSKMGKLITSSLSLVVEKQ